MTIVTLAKILKIGVWFIVTIFDLIMVYVYVKKKKEKKVLKKLFPLLAGLIFTLGWLLFLWIIGFSFCCEGVNIQNLY